MTEEERMGGVDPLPLQSGPALPSPEPTRRRGVGTVDTPRSLAAYVAETALEWLGRRPARVVDPSVGHGALLDPLQDTAGTLVGIDTDAEAVREARRRLPTADLRVGDALAPETLETGGFDLVIGNPPWVSYSGRQAAQLSADEATRYAAFESWTGWRSLHGLFLERGAQLLCEGGVLAMLAPRAVCTHTGYAAIRGVLRRVGEVTAVDLGEDAFAGVIQPTALILLRRGDAATASAPGSSVAVAPPVPNPAPDLLAELVARVRRHPRPAPESFGDPGVHTGNSARLLLRREGGEGWHPIREGRDVSLYQLATPSLWVRVGAELPPGRYARIGPLARYRAARVVIRQTADRPVAAVHSEPTYFRNSLLACYGVAGLDDDALVAILNSVVVAAYHGATAADARQRSFPQVKVAHLRGLPLPRQVPAELAELGRLQRVVGVSAARQARIEELVAAAYGVVDWLPFLLESGYNRGTAE